MAVQALKDGATDFLPKPVSADRLLTAIERAVSKDVERRQQNQLTDEYRHVFDTLTAREKMVAKKVARDCSINRSLTNCRSVKRPSKSTEDLFAASSV